jgi:hypothetical protein
MYSSLKWPTSRLPRRGWQVRSAWLRTWTFTCELVRASLLTRFLVSGIRCIAGIGRLLYSAWISSTDLFRLLSAELGSTPTISDEDFDVDLPAMLDECSPYSDTTQPDQPTFLVSLSHLTRMIKPLVLTIYPRGISNELLRSYAESLASCMQSFPHDLQLSSNTPLDPINLPTITAFQNTCLLVYRQNLSSQCAPEQRLQAIEQCLNVACDTSSFMSRCMCVQPHFPDWRSRLSTSASTLLCTHLWRCTLFTLHRGYHDASLTLIRSLATIGDDKEIVIHCGRYISFFLQQVLSRMEKSISLDTDEELLAYLSADLQSNARTAWIWGETQSPSHPPRDGSYFPRPASPALNRHLSDKERNDWGGWEYIERTVLQLQQQQLLLQPRSLPHPSAQMQSQQQPRNRMDISHIT